MPLALQRQISQSQLILQPWYIGFLDTWEAQIAFPLSLFHRCTWLTRRRLGHNFCCPIMVRTFMKRERLLKGHMKSFSEKTDHLGASCCCCCCCCFYCPPPTSRFFAFASRHDEAAEEK